LSTSDEENGIRELTRRAKEGDRGAFALLYEHFRARLRDSVRSWARFQLGPPVDVEEILQDTFTRALTSLKGFSWSGEDAFFRWLCGVAKRALAQAAADIVRNQSRRAGTSSTVERRAAPDPTQSKIMRREERFDRLKRALDKLTPEYREVLILSRIEGVSVKEIAARSGRSPRRVKYILACALRELRAVFGETDSLHLPARLLGEGGSEDDSGTK